MKDAMADGSTPERGMAPENEPEVRVDSSMPLFNDFMFGLVVVDGSRTVTAVNEAASRVLNGAGGETHGVGALCCDLICRYAPAELNGACLADQVESTELPTDELRVDLPSSGTRTAAWVTVARLERSHDYLFHLRPGLVNDRRRRMQSSLFGASHATEVKQTAEMRVTALGRFSIEVRHEPITGPWQQQRPGQLLRYLISNRDRRVTIEEIAEALWTHPGEQTLGSVRYSIHVLRSILEPSRKSRAPSTFISTSGAGYRLNEALVEVDADRFEDLAAEGAGALTIDDRDRAKDNLAAAARLYGGDFLADDLYADWAIPERERLRYTASLVLRRLAIFALEDGESLRATEFARRLSDLEPLDGELQRYAIEVYLSAGRRGEAARRFETYAKRLRGAYGERPDFTLADVATGLAKGPSALS